MLRLAFKYDVERQCITSKLEEVNCRQNQWRGCKKC